MTERSPLEVLAENLMELRGLSANAQQVEIIADALRLGAEEARQPCERLQQNYVEARRRCRPCRWRALLEKARG